MSAVTPVRETGPQVSWKGGDSGCSRAPSLRLGLQPLDAGPKARLGQEDSTLGTQASVPAGCGQLVVERPDFQSPMPGEPVSTRSPGCSGWTPVWFPSLPSPLTSTPFTPD